MDEKDKVLLEMFVNTYGIKDVTETLGTICFEIAEHLMSNWQMSPNSIEVRDWTVWGKRLT